MTTQATEPEWVLHPRYAPATALALAEALGAPPAIGNALVHRGISDVETAPASSRPRSTTCTSRPLCSISSAP